MASDPPVRFRRARGMLPLPEPQRGGKLDDLRNIINVDGDDDYLLVRGWLIGALRRRGPYPVLGIHGEQGSAKSTLCRLLRDLIDPNAAGLRAEPRDAHDLIIAATNGWIIALDNVSHLPVWLSDALCRLATGGGFGTRELYTDNEEMLFDAQRPTLLNGITEVATRADLLDRSILIEVPQIPDDRRRTETELMRAFAAVRPLLLGALFDHVVTALQQVDHVRLDRMPRMADFAVWVVAADESRSDEFLGAYARNRAGANDTAIEASEIGSYVLALVGERGEIVGTSADLLRLLTERVDDSTRRRRGWPRDGRALRGALARIVPNLRASGCDVTWGERGEYPEHRRWVRLRPESTGIRLSASSAPSEAVPVQAHSPDGGPDGPPDGTTAVREKATQMLRQDGPDGLDGKVQPLSTGADEERF